MIHKVFAAFAPLAAAAAALFAATTTAGALDAILDTATPAGGPPTVYTALQLVGVVAWVPLGCGAVALTRRPLRGRLAVTLTAAAAVLLVLAAIAIAIGNGQVRATLMLLAQSATFEIDVFRAATAAARIALGLGWGLGFLGVLLWWLAPTAPALSSSQAVRSRGALVLAILALLMMTLASLARVTQLHGCQAALGVEATKPTVLADCISALVISGWLAALGWLLIALAATLSLLSGRANALPVPAADA